MLRILIPTESNLQDLGNKKRRYLQTKEHRVTLNSSQTRIVTWSSLASRICRIEPPCIRWQRGCWTQGVGSSTRRRWVAVRNSEAPRFSSHNFQDSRCNAIKQKALAKAVGSATALKISSNRWRVEKRHPSLCSLSNVGVLSSRVAR